MTLTLSSREEPPGAPGRAQLSLAASLGGGKAGWDGTGRVINRVVCQALAGPSFPFTFIGAPAVAGEGKSSKN